MDPLLEKLHDIEGLDLIHSWPLAIGWWVVIAIGSLALCWALYFFFSWVKFRRSWKNDTLKKLAVLESALSEETAGESVIQLSEFLRRIAVRRFPRKACAALLGTDWLKWLSENDPAQFDWVKEGVLFIEIPYAPPQKVEANQVKKMIQAVKKWVR